LLQELYDFPSAKNDDLSDALAYLVDLAPTIGKSHAFGTQVNSDPYPQGALIEKDIEQLLQEDEEESTGVDLDVY